MSRNFLPCLIAIKAIAAAAPVLAQGGPQSGAATTLDRLIVTAGRNEGSIATVAQSVIVLERDDIDKALRVAPDGTSLIARIVPGFSVSNQGVSGASESFRGRGVLIMVDGIPRNTPLRDVSRILSMIDMTNVERIEVINGASSLYGAGATGGTINFVTRRGQSETPRVTVTTGLKAQTADIGNSAAPNAAVSVAGRSGNTHYFLSASGSATQRAYDGRGNEMASDAMLGQGGSDRAKSGNLFAVVGHENGPHSFEISADWTYFNQSPEWLTDYSRNRVAPNFTDPYVGEPLIENSKYFTAQYANRDFFLGGLKVKLFHNDIFKQAPFSKLSRTNGIVYFSGDFRNPTAWFNQSALNVSQTGANVTINTPIDIVSSGASLTWGMDYTIDSTKQTTTRGDTIIAPMRQNTISAFMQAEIPLGDRLRLQGGLRYDNFHLKVDHFRRPTALLYPGTSRRFLYPQIQVLGGSFDYDALTFNAGAVLNASDALQLFANFSQGYSLTDIGAFTRRAGANSRAEICDAYGAIAAAFGCKGRPDFTVSYANIAPEPQLVNTYEAGFRGDWGQVRASASAWMSTSENGVNYDFQANRVSQQKEEIWGIESTAEYDINDIYTIGGLFAFREGRYDANNDGRIGADEYLPNNRISTTYKALAFVSAQWNNGIWARGEVEYFSGRNRIAGQRIGHAALFNLAVSKTFNDDSVLSIAVNNVFDKDYINPTATATRGVAVPGLGRTVQLSYKKEF